MNAINLINLTQAEAATPIYRVFPVFRFLELLDTKQNALLRPEKWDDPFENLILKGIAQTAGGQTAQWGFKNDLFGQCWSLEIESDALWRIYSPQKDGVKVRTTIEKLFNSLYNVSGSTRDISCFIGKVEYLVKKSLQQWLGSVNPLDSTGRGAAETLYVKRAAFRYEKEVRLVYFDHSNQPKSDIHLYSTTPNSTFEECVLDPRMDERIANAYKDAIKKRKFSGKVVQSSLYKEPQPVVTKLP